MSVSVGTRRAAAGASAARTSLDAVTAASRPPQAAQIEPNSSLTHEFAAVALPTSTLLATTPASSSLTIVERILRHATAHERRVGSKHAAATSIHERMARREAETARVCALRWSPRAEVASLPSK